MKTHMGEDDQKTLQRRQGDAKGVASPLTIAHRHETSGDSDVGTVAGHACGLAEGWAMRCC